MSDTNHHPTPITDAAAIALHGTRLAPGCIYVKAEDMRNLERQLAEAIEELEANGLVLQKLQNERDEVREQRDRLAAWSERLIEIIGPPPTPNCSCHLSPPCNDCVDYSGLREAIQEIEESLASSHYRPTEKGARIIRETLKGGAR